ncbi:MAG: hypothetical protein ACFFFH_05735 [Candidatus Thorarchaeota archaeon]
MPKKSIDLERSEIRYIFFSNDQDSLISDFSNIGFEELHYKETPVTQTVYFGSKLGLKPGLSIKARVYSPENIQNSWQITRDTPFNFLEVKSTVSQENKTQSLISDSHAKMTQNVIFRIQRASEDGLLRDSSLKIKSRLKRSLTVPESSISILTFSEIVTLLTEPSELDEELSEDAKNLLNSKIRPLYHKSLKPHMMTQYSRIHLVPKPEYSDWKKIIRITIDPGVEYYALTQKGDIKVNPDTLVEFVTKEQHCRLEFKLDPLRVKEERLNEKIADILRKYGCIAC